MIAGHTDRLGRLFVPNLQSFTKGIYLLTFVNLDSGRFRGYLDEWISPGNPLLTKRRNFGESRVLLGSLATKFTTSKTMQDRREYGSAFLEIRIFLINCLAANAHPTNGATDLNPEFACDQSDRNDVVDLI